MRHLSKLLILLFIFLINGCGSDDVSSVSDGYLSFDKSITVGQALNGYKYFKTHEWSSFKAENGRKIVQFKAKFVDEMLTKTGRVNWGTGEIPTYSGIEIIIQFRINSDQTFQIEGSRETFFNTNGKTEERQISDSDLLDIYENREPSF